MTQNFPASIDSLARPAPIDRHLGDTSVTSSGVSWGAIFAGAAGAAALSLILLILGTGLGLSSVSPWVDHGASATAFGVSTIAWITLTSLLASGMGGYIAGRLRIKWSAVHTDEVYFRDTAHGFLAWAVATLITAGALTSTIGGIVSTGAQSVGAVAGGAATAGTAAAAGAAKMSANNGMPGESGMGYTIDSMFRKDMTASGAATAPANGGDTTASTAEVGRIVATSMSNGAMSPDDTKYVGQMVAQRTGLSQQDAEKRVTDSFNAMKAKVQAAADAARDAADKARKASAGAALWLFVSLLIGAFVASLAATYGGRRRDLY